MHFDLSVHDRYFGHVGEVAAEGEVYGDAPAHSFGQWLSPSWFFRPKIQDSQISRLFRQQVTAELVGIFLGQACEFIDEALDGKRSVGVAYGAQPLHGCTTAK